MNCYISTTNVSCLLFPAGGSGRILSPQKARRSLDWGKRRSLPRRSRMKPSSGLPSAAGISWLTSSEKFYKLFTRMQGRKSSVGESGTAVVYCSTWRNTKMSIEVRRLLRFVLCVGFLTSLSLTPAFAQSDLGRISGFVKDPSGAVVPSAKVTVQNNSGVVRQATTNESGYYTITNVPPGLYTMTTEAPGFRRYQSKDNKLDPSAALVIDATLTVGTVAETVDVWGSAAQLQTESASVQKLITREQIDSLELNGRNPVGLASL